MSILGSLITRGSAISSKMDFFQSTPLQSQHRTLKRLLKQASKSSFGKFYQFDKILQSDNLIEAFQSNIPIFDYEKMYNEWWHLSMKKQDSVTWKDNVKYFALSSGTTGAASKYIPITKATLRLNSWIAFKMLMTLPKFGLDSELYTKDMLMLGGCCDLEDKGGVFVGDLSGINTHQMPSWLQMNYRPGKEIAKIADWDERINEIVRRAPEWDVGFIMGIPAWLQLMIEKIIEHYNLDHIHQIWPNLKVFIHGGVAFEPYKKSFEKLVSHPLIYIDTYLASEGFIAFQNHPKATGMSMLLNHGIFFEFIPFNSDNFDELGNVKPNPEVLHIEQVKEGVDYALMMSTCAGAWRYLIGDTVRFTDKARSEIIITGRTKHFLSICGEHLSVENMNQAVKRVEDELECSIREFTVKGVPDGNFFKHKWYLGCDENINEEVLRNCLDKNLQELNDDYSTERSAVLGMEVTALPVATFYQWHAVKGKLGGQYKFPRVMRNEEFEEWEQFVGQRFTEKIE